MNHNYNTTWENRISIANCFRVPVNSSTQSSSAASARCYTTPSGRTRPHTSMTSTTGGGVPAPASTARGGSSIGPSSTTRRRRREPSSLSRRRYCPRIRTVPPTPLDRKHKMPKQIHINSSRSHNCLKIRYLSNEIWYLSTIEMGQNLKIEKDAIKIDFCPLRGVCFREIATAARSRTLKNVQLWFIFCSIVCYSLQLVKKY